MSAKRFFYASAGVLCLAVASAIASSNVGGTGTPRAGQALGGLVPAACSGYHFATEDGQVFRSNVPPFPGTFILIGAIPTTNRVVAIGELYGGNGSFAVTHNGDLFHKPNGGGEWALSNNIYDTISNEPPGDGPVIDATRYEGESIIVLTAQGNAYEGGIPGWRYLGNMFDGPISVKATTWSKVKVEYREGSR